MATRDTLVTAVGTNRGDRLIDGIDVALPIVACETGTMQTARALSRAAGRIGPDSTRKIDTAIQVLGNRLAT
mgnify:CR=1 FL=1